MPFLFANIFGYTAICNYLFLCDSLTRYQNHFKPGNEGFR